MAENTALKKFLVAALLLIVVVVLGVWLFGRLTTGQVDVKVSPEGSAVTIQQLGSDGQIVAGSTAISGKGNFSARVSPGTYQVLVYSKSFSTDKVVSVKARQVVSVQLSLKVAVSPEPVYGGQTNGLVASSPKLVFIDTATGLLSKIDAQNKVAVLDSAHPLKSASWASSEIGAALGLDGNLYQVRSGVLTPISLPFATNKNSKVVYGLSGDRTLYVSNGQDVYAGQLGSSLSKVYSSGSNYNSAISASNAEFAIIEHDSANNYPEMKVIGKDGKTEYQKSGTEQAYWSPSGKYLLAVQGVNARLLNGSFEQIAQISASDSSVYGWFDDNTLVYGAGKNINTFDVSLKVSTKIAEVPGAQSAVSIYQNDGSSYVYFAANKSNPDGGTGPNQLFRVGLSGQKVDDKLLGLSVILPDTFGGCYVNYVVFTQPSIQSTAPPGAPASYCEKYVTGALAVFGFDTSKINTNYSTSN